MMPYSHTIKGFIINCQSICSINADFYKLVPLQKYNYIKKAIDNFSYTENTVLKLCTKI